MKKFNVMRRLFAAVMVLAVVFAGSLAFGGAYRVVVMPKIVGIDYFNAVEDGVKDAAKELGDKVEVIWMGPTVDQVEKQIELIDNLIATKPDAICVASNDNAAIVPILKKANRAGIKVLSWDGDADFRDFFVNLVNYDEFGKGLVEAMVKEIGPEGDIAIVTTTFTAPNQVMWIKGIEKHIAAAYPKLKIVDTRPAGESTEKAYRITQDYLKSMPNLKGIIALGVPNVPGTIDAVKEAGMTGKVAVVGNATPNVVRKYLKDGDVKSILLWDAPAHGYLTVYSAYRLLTDGLSVGVPYDAGRMGKFTPAKDDISMQVSLPIMVFTKDNVDQFNF